MDFIERSTETWGLVHRSKGAALEGYHEHLIRENCVPVLFSTRREARAYRDKRFGYIRDREELRTWPHGLKMPKVVRVRTTVIRTEDD